MVTVRKTTESERYTRTVAYEISGVAPSPRSFYRNDVRRFLPDRAEITDNGSRVVGVEVSGAMVRKDGTPSLNRHRETLRRVDPVPEWARNLIPLHCDEYGLEGWE